MGFNPCNFVLKIWESFWDSNSQHGSSFGSVRVHALTLFALSGTCEVTPRSSSWPTTFQPLAFIASPRLRLRHLCNTKDSDICVSSTYGFDYMFVQNSTIPRNMHQKNGQFTFRFPYIIISLRVIGHNQN
jgi:hypothetical protein